VVVTHLHAGQPSLLAELLGRNRDEHGKVAGPPCVAVDITFPP